MTLISIWQSALMISSYQHQINPKRRIKRSYYHLAKGPLACLRLIQKYESLPQGKGYCHLNQTKIGELLINHGHKAVKTREVKKYFSLLKMLGLIKCYKVRTKSSYETNTTNLAKLYLKSNKSKQSEVQKTKHKKDPTHTLTTSRKNRGPSAFERASDGPTKITNAQCLTSKVGFLTGFCYDAYDEYTSLKDNRCNATSNDVDVNGKIGTLLETPKGNDMSDKSSDPRKIFNFAKYQDKKTVDPKQMLEYINARQDQYDANFMERQWSQKKDRWESYKQANQYAPDFDKFEFEKKMKRKEWERMKEESRITNEKIKSTKDCLDEMAKKADDNRPSDEFVQSKMAQMRAMLQARKTT
jgi:hypothetical protein